MKEDGCLEMIVIVVGLILLVAAITLLFAFPFMWIWNAVLPAVFGWPTVTYWQAAGLMVLLQVVGGFFRSSSSKSE